MPQVLVRGVDPDDLASLKERARENGRSLEAELRIILRDAARRQRRNFWQIAARLRERTAGRPHTDSAELIREDRDR